MNASNIRCFDALQNVLSKVCRVFTEIVFFKSFSEQRKTDDQHKSALVGPIERVLKTLPAREVEARFHLQAASNAAKSLSATSGLFKTYFLSSLGDAVPDIAEKGVSMDVGGLFKPLTGLLGKCIEMYDKEHVDGWFRKCFDWSWLATLAHSGTDLTFLSQGKFQDWYDKDQGFALCSLEVLMKIVENPKADPVLKETLITTDNEGANLYSLASLKNWRKSFWEVRYLATHHLIQLALNPDYAAFKESCIQFLAIRLVKEDRPLTSDMIKQACQDSKDPGLWIAALQQVNPKKLKQEVQEELERIQIELEQEVKSKAEQAAKQAGAGFVQQSNLGDYGPPVLAPQKEEGKQADTLEGDDLATLQWQVQQQHEMGQKSLARIDMNLAFIDQLMHTK